MGRVAENAHRGSGRVQVNGDWILGWGGVGGPEKRMVESENFSLDK